jgi:hypothetical protein
METPARYRGLAAECLRLVAMAKTEEHRKILREMAHAWQQVAEAAETQSEAGIGQLKVCRRASAVE